MHDETKEREIRRLVRVIHRSLKRDNPGSNVVGPVDHDRGGQTAIHGEFRLHRLARLIIERRASWLGTAPEVEQQRE